MKVQPKKHKRGSTEICAASISLWTLQLLAGYNVTLIIRNKGAVIMDSPINAVQWSCTVVRRTGKSLYGGITYDYCP